MEMNTEYGMAAIAIACAAVLFIVIMKRKAEFILNFMVRSVLGLLGIYLINTVLEQQKIAIVVGMNPVSAVTAGTLGFSGIALLYGIVFYKSL